MMINEERLLGFQEAFSDLAPMEQMVLECRFKERKTFKEIGISVNRTTERARIIYQHGIRKMGNRHRLRMLVLGYHRALEEFYKEEATRWRR